MLWLPFAAMIVAGQATPDGPVAGQVAPRKLDEPVRLDDVEVFGRRGAARLAPEIELNGADIDALGVWDIGEVLRRMTETLGLGEEPMILINGKRAPAPGVFYGFPPDALVRAEVLPAEAASLYGGTPGQRVVNLVLQRRFSSYDGRMSGGRPTQGGTSSLSAELRRSAISDGNTHQLGLNVSRDTALNAEERDRDLADEGPEAGRVTVRPRADVISASANLTRALGAWSGVFSLNGQAENSRSVAQFGDEIVDIVRRVDSLAGVAGVSGTMASWSVQANLNGQASRSQEDGFVDTRSENQSVGLAGFANRTLVNLPTGPLVINLNGNLMESRLAVEGQETSTFHAREARGSLSVPLSNANGGGTPGRFLGGILATVGGGYRKTNAGDGDDVNAALVWTPRKGVQLNGVWSASSDSVSDLMRFEPPYHGTPRVVFDFLTGMAVEIVPVMGGNPELRPPRSERLFLTAALGPFTSWSLSGNLGFQRVESTDGFGSLPDLTEDVEAAFPDRFQRDADGRLVSIDYRPLNLHSSLTESLTTGLNFNLPRPTDAAAGEAMIARVSLSHNLRLRSRVVLLEGLPELDRLKGDGGGLAGQDVAATIDARRGRWGVNASARWQDGYRTRRIGGLDSAEDLVIQPFAAVDVKLSFQMTSLAARTSSDEEGAQRRRSAGLQLALEIDNLFDERPVARLGDGSPAPGYGRDVQDPLGRMVRVTLQRRF